MRESMRAQQNPTASSNHLAPPTVSMRRSMDSYYRPLPPLPPPSPPLYSEFLFPQSIRHFNIQPREDEGREILPSYSTAISLQSVFSQKHELEHAVHKASDRSWHRVMVTLQGTALTFHKCKVPGISTTFSPKSTPDYPAGTTKGAFIKSYNLTHADVGIAADYIKRKYVIRLRAETEQFLLSCHKIETFVLWLQSLSSAIDLAPALDDREIPLDLSIPRRPRRRRREVVAQPATESTEQLVREQEDVIRSFPDLGDGSARRDIDEGEEEDDESEDTGTPRTRTSSPQPSAFSNPSRSSVLHSATIPTPIPVHTSSTSFPHLLLRTRAILSTTLPALPPTPTTPTHPSLIDGKWAPRHEWTPFYDMLYAKRCMAVLTHRSPRKSKYVVVRGKRCVVDWATGRVEREDPPGYGEWEVGSTAVGLKSVKGRELRDKEKRVLFRRGGKRVVVGCAEV